MPKRSKRQEIKPRIGLEKQSKPSQVVFPRRNPIWKSADPTSIPNKTKNEKQFEQK